MGGSVISAGHLREQVAGEVLDPSAEAYDQARRVWNGTVDRKPAVVVRATSVADVVATVRHAHETGAPLAIRCGGHSIAGLSTCDDGIVLDLRAMNDIVVDPAARTAEVGGGALLGELDAATMAHGLATPTGTVGHTGVAGLALGGGLGRLMRKHGATCDNILWAEMVTADGSVVRTSESEEPELFWGVRGAGENFGVVTRFGFALHPQNETAFASLTIHAIEDATEALTFYENFAPNAPDDMVVVASLGHLAPGSPAPPELIGRSVLTLAAAHAGDDQAAAEAATAPLREFGTPLHTMFVGMPYLFFQGMMDEAYAWGKRFYDKGGYLESLSDATIDTMLEQHEAAGPGGGELSLFGLGGAFGRVPEDAMAFSGRTMPFFLNIEASWEDPADDDARITWGRETGRAMAAHFSGANYINAVDTEDASATERAYGSDKYKRLVELKQQWDPDNVFRLNHNITP